MQSFKPALTGQFLKLHKRKESRQRCKSSQTASRLNLTPSSTTLCEKNFSETAQLILFQANRFRGSYTCTLCKRTCFGVVCIYSKLAKKKKKKKNVTSMLPSRDIIKIRTKRSRKITVTLYFVKRKYSSVSSHCKAQRPAAQHNFGKQSNVQEHIWGGRQASLKWHPYKHAWQEHFCYTCGEGWFT